MSITATSSLDPSASIAASSAPGSSGVSSAASEQRFLKLLVTQLKNQDPLNPLQNAELTSQLAQMSTVTGIEKLNTALQALVSQSGAGQALQAASLVGRSVLVPGGELIGGNGPVPFAVELPSSAGSVKVTINDAAGNTVRSFDAGPMSQGVHDIAWDGKNDAGQTAAAGTYKVKVLAMNGATLVAAAGLVYSQVTSVTQGSGGVSLDLASGQSIALSGVRKIL